MALDENSTFDDIQREYMATASYRAPADVDKANRFVVACEFLLLKLPAQSAQGGESIAMSPSLIENALLRARTWLTINDPNTTEINRGGVVHPDFMNFRN